MLRWSMQWFWVLLPSTPFTFLLDAILSTILFILENQPILVASRNWNGWNQTLCVRGLLMVPGKVTINEVT